MAFGSRSPRFHFHRWTLDRFLIGLVPLPVTSQVFSPVPLVAGPLGSPSSTRRLLPGDDYLFSLLPGVGSFSLRSLGGLVPFGSALFNPLLSQLLLTNHAVVPDVQVRSKGLLAPSFFSIQLCFPRPLRSSRPVATLRAFYRFGVGRFPFPRKSSSDR